MRREQSPGHVGKNRGYGSLLSAIPASIALAVEPYGDDGPQWVVAQAEAEIVERYGFLDDGERDLTAPCSIRRTGPFWWPAAAMPPDRRSAGPGCAPSSPGIGEVRRLWVDPGFRGQGIARALMAALEDASRDIGLRTCVSPPAIASPRRSASTSSTGWERVFVAWTAARCLTTSHLVGEAARAVTATVVSPFDIVCEIEPATTPDLTAGATPDRRALTQASGTSRKSG